MRQPARIKGRRSQVSQTYSVPAPIRGWNARDSLASMKPGDAAVLVNFFPTTDGAEIRGGSTSFSTGIKDGSGNAIQVETLVSYRPVSGTHKLFAFAGARLFDVTAGGVVGAAIFTSLSNARWQVTNFTTSGGNFIICVNGADSPLLYDGTTWTALTGVSTPAITGVTSSTLIGINVFKERVWYIQNNTLDVWYSGVQQFAGALVKMPLGSVFKRGGFLVAMGTWSVDGGQGQDDLALFITSQGEVAVYQGIDPSSINTWTLIGVFNIGAPIGRRCMTKYQGDLLLITQDGIVSASTALTDRRTNTSKAITDRISGAAGAAAGAYASNFGWELCQYQTIGALILNVPVTTGQQEQYVMNTTTNSWCRFNSWPSNTFEVHNQALYFGCLGEVRKAWTGTADLGANIIAEAVGAFDYFGNRDGQKVVRMIRPVIGWDANPAEILLNVDVDFIITTPTGAVSLPSGSASSLWDTGLWDTALWAGDVSLNRTWYSASGLGYAVAPHIKITSSASRIKLIAFDYLFERGGVL